MYNLILFGPPGSGKGTQSDLLIQHYGLLHLATGDLLRSEVSKKTTLGLEAQKYIDNGQLVPDEVVIGMIDSKLDEHKDSVKGIIFDGFPRTVEQAAALDKLLADRNTEIHQMVALEVSEDVLTQRLLQRGEVSGRSDDNLETITKRIVEYKSKTEPVANYYKERGKLSAINGVGAIEEIFNSIKSVLDTHLSSITQ